MSKILKKTESLLNNIVSEDIADAILSNMFPEPIKGYKKWKVLTVGELKSLPQNSIIHLWYKDDCDCLRNNDFVVFCGYDGDDELSTTDGFSMPIGGHADDELIKNFDNTDWTFTVCEAILKNK